MGLEASPHPPTKVLTTLPETWSHPLETPPGTGRSTGLGGGRLRDILEPRSLLAAGQAHFLLSDNHQHPPTQPQPSGAFSATPRLWAGPAGALRTQSPAF